MKEEPIKQKDIVSLVLVLALLALMIGCAEMEKKLLEHWDILLGLLFAFLAIAALVAHMLGIPALLAEIVVGIFMAYLFFLLIKVIVWE